MRNDRTNQSHIITTEKKKTMRCADRNYPFTNTTMIKISIFLFRPNRPSKNITIIRLVLIMQNIFLGHIIKVSISHKWVIFSRKTYNTTYLTSFVSVSLEVWKLLFNYCERNFYFWVISIIHNSLVIIEIIKNRTITSVLSLFNMNQFNHFSQIFMINIRSCN